MKASLGIPVISFGLALAAGTPAAAQDDSPRTTIHPSAEQTQPLEAGDMLPHPVTVRDKEGESHTLRDLLNADGPTVFVFYRGGWCPFCTAHLAELAQISGTLKEGGAEIIGISPDAPGKIATYGEEQELPYTILSDSSARAMAAFGIAFAVEDEMVDTLRGYGMDLSEWSGNDRNILPVPAVFVVDDEGEITFAYANPDYRVRLDGEELLRQAGVEAPAGEAAPQ